MPPSSTPKNKPMSETFNRITNIVCDELTNIIEENRHRKDILDQKQAENEHFNIADEYNQRDFITDFATEEFINKNIRVRPISGATNIDKDEQKSDMLGGKGYLGVGMDAN